MAEDSPQSSSNSISPTVWATIIVALLSVGGTLVVASKNATAQRELEREQFESNLILKAISTGDKKQSYENIRFLVEAHLIRKESDKVSPLLQDTSFHFHLSEDKPVVQSASSSQSALTAPIVAYEPAFSGVIVDEATGKPLKGVTISVKTRRSRMRDIETYITGEDGKFKLHYPPRSYYLDYTLVGYTGQRTWHMAGGRFKEPLTLKMKRAGS